MRLAGFVQVLPRVTFFHAFSTQIPYNHAKINNLQVLAPSDPPL
mgnify:CR=1 FL=1